MKLTVSDWLYPRHCPLCDKILKKEEPLVCRWCAAAVPLIRGPACMKCGRPLVDLPEPAGAGANPIPKRPEVGTKAVTGERPGTGAAAFPEGSREYCADCRKRKHLFEQGFAPYVYRDDIQISLLRMKYSGRAEYARFYAASIWHAGKRRLRQWSPDMIVPVPIHIGRWRKRGYNQAEELARRLSELSGIPAAEPVLRARHTLPQKGLSPRERRRNVRGAFLLSRDAAVPGTVLLIDDIYTTGSTLDEIAGVLFAGGAQRIFFVCAAVSPGSV